MRKSSARRSATPSRTSTASGTSSLQLTPPSLLPSLFTSPPSLSPSQSPLLARLRLTEFAYLIAKTSLLRVSALLNTNGISALRQRGFGIYCLNDTCFCGLSICFLFVFPTHAGVACLSVICLVGEILHLSSGMCGSSLCPCSLSLHIDDMCTCTVSSNKAENIRKII